MMNKTIFLLVVVAAFCITRTVQLSCPKCNLLDCPRDDPTPNCKYGVGKDACGCCPRCYGGPGDECGGPWKVLGICAEGFVCLTATGQDVGFQGDGTCQEESSP